MVSETFTPETLLTAAARGDREAFSRFYQEISPKLFALALRILRRRDWAEESLQEAFIKAWLHVRDYRVEKGSALAWMSTILRHLALDRLRRARHEPIALPDAALEGEERGFTDNGVLLSGESKALQKCLEELEEEQRRGILLSYFEGLTHQELSVRMKKPLGTVKTWIRRGLEKLRGCLERTHGQRE